MRIAKIRKITGFWKSFSFVGNISKMRKTLMDYLTEEGLKSEIQDGWISFAYQGVLFSANFILHDDYAECIIVYRCIDEDYASLSIEEKSFIADSMNKAQQNHVTVFGFEDELRLTTTFYFSNSSMMLNLFYDHFMELTETYDLTVELVRTKIDEHKKFKSRPIGFIRSSDNEEASLAENEIVAKV